MCVIGELSTGLDPALEARTLMVPPGASQLWIARRSSLWMSPFDATMFPI
jgi:hypothetical protein